MSKAIDITNQKFGRLIAIKSVGSRAIDVQRARSFKAAEHVAIAIP